MKLQYTDVSVPKEIETAFQAATTGRADAVLVMGGYVFNSQVRQVAEYAMKRRLPAVYQASEYVEAGG